MLESEAQRGIALAAFCGVVLSASTAAQRTTRVSTDSQGGESIAGGELRPGTSMTPDGRRVVFASSASNLVAGDTNANWDVFVRDRMTGSVERCSVSSIEEQGDRLSGLYGICISADGRYVGFGSRATNLVSADTNGVSDVFLRDLVAGTTDRISLSSSWVQGDGASWHPAFSSDVRFVAFTSSSSNFVPGDTNGRFDVFVRDRSSGTTERVSVATGGAEAWDDSYQPAISADGRFVTFESLASNLVAGDVNVTWDVFVRDRWTGTTERISQSSSGVQGNDASWESSISGDGRYVVFSSYASNLVAGDQNADLDVFLRDRTLGTTQRVSVASNGAEGDRASSGPSIGSDPRYVVFTSSATTFAPGAGSGLPHVFVRDLALSTTTLVTSAYAGGEPDNGCANASISGDGRYVSFDSAATNLVAGDHNRSPDVFVHDFRATGAQVMCEPGLAGVRVCPCGNPPAGAGRGCNNSSATGGASLSASGIAYLSADSLTFTTSGERPTALSTLFEGTSQLASGAVLGQGVRCVGGQLVRLYAKAASGGSITVPDGSVGEPSVSARSAAKGLPIQPGLPCFFYVAYRDATVLGSCPSSSTFNATNAIRVVWWP